MKGNEGSMLYKAARAVSPACDLTLCSAPRSKVGIVKPIPLPRSLFTVVGK